MYILLQIVVSTVVQIVVPTMVQIVVSTMVQIVVPTMVQIVVSILVHVLHHRPHSVSLLFTDTRPSTGWVGTIFTEPNKTTTNCM